MMAAMLELRPPLPEDADPLWRIARERGVMETTMGLASRPRTDYVERIEQPSPDQHTLVAVLDGKVVGWGGLTVRGGRQRHAADLGLAVGAAHQGEGVGTALLTALLELADGWLGLRRIELTVLTGNDRARALYERHGFEVEGRLRGYVAGEGALRDVWVMGRLRPALERADD
jgi:putative acetyltransferase